jgi:hypothetical protein
MIELNDICKIAKVVKQELDIVEIKKGDNNVIDNMEICLQLSDFEMDVLDETLYKRENKSFIGYKKSDEIEINILGINFRLKRKKED